MKNALLSAMLAIVVATTGSMAAKASHSVSSQCTSDQTTCDFIRQLIQNGG